MAIIGIQGERGGVGTSSVTAALGWALKQLDEKVLLIDASPDNMLRLFFNIEIPHSGGWASAMINNQPWQPTGWHYANNLEVLPFGTLTTAQRLAASAADSPLMGVLAMLHALEESRRWQWILIDLPAGYSALNQALVAMCPHLLTVVTPDANCHVRLHQQLLAKKSHLLVNNFMASSELQSDILQLWLKGLPRVLPVVIHRDEAMAESLAAKQPVGEYRSGSLAAQEMLTLANWCLLHFPGGRG
ncbi:cellulose synthase operon protein YhjQ [Shimwellia pseudoproteus]|uniref:cellulose biosynthesis protein BcsQ n=1 Tax=Shimwellia pseudoproteus TaxID=570012 RepID=UPI0018EC39C5|nr:cellulose biosynthesis protein BcsQ [Shimwellia pseudoproteus]MBJ3814276.1 cellulose synthase operon protein YhjQ [Shimwellia pseudoproteus]